MTKPSRPSASASARAGGDALGGKTLKFFFGEGHRALAGRRHEVAAEFFRERGEALVDLGEAGLAGRVEVGALAGKGAQEVVVEALAFFVFGRGRGLLDSRVEYLVLIHRVIVRGQSRVDVGGDLLHLLGDVRAGEVAKDRHDAVEVLAGALERLHRVFPRRGGRVVGDGGDFGVVKRECLVEGGAVVLHLDLRERRELVGQ